MSNRLDSKFPHLGIVLRVCLMIAYTAFIFILCPGMVSSDSTIVVISGVCLLIVWAYTMWLACHGIVKSLTKE